MRSGRLLAEEAPQVLLSIYGCQSLEEVFLKLSRKQQGSESNNPQEVETNNTALVSTYMYNLGTYNNSTYRPISIYIRSHSLVRK